MITLNAIEQYFNDWFKNHLMLNSYFIFEGDFDFNGERNILYPTVNVEWMTSTIVPNSAGDDITNHVFKVTIADTALPDNLRQENNIFSDALQIAEEFLYSIKKTPYFMYGGNTVISKFVDDNPDRTSGIWFNVVIGIKQPSKRCSTPTKE